MGGSRHWAGAPLITTLLLGGSFNPAHGGHRRISLFAAKQLGVAEVWWLVSPGNPLKAATTDMAPLSTRIRSAKHAARRSPIKPTAIEQQLGTRYTVDTLRKIVARYPNRRFIWMMGADNLIQFYQWREWRKIATIMPIAVVARPGYDGTARTSRVMGWFRRFVHPLNHAKDWTKWRPPALVLMRFRPDKSSATALRLANPDWRFSFSPNPVRDPVTRRFIY
jgi:nicotinate-nucleotide adenylyltransferase